MNTPVQARVGRPAGARQSGAVTPVTRPQVVNHYNVQAGHRRDAARRAAIGRSRVGHHERAQALPDHLPRGTQNRGSRQSDHAFLRLRAGFGLGHRAIIC